jgi:hypothetical protein
VEKIEKSVGQKEKDHVILHFGFLWLVKQHKSLLSILPQRGLCLPHHHFPPPQTKLRVSALDTLPHWARTTNCSPTGFEPRRRQVLSLARIRWVIGSLSPTGAFGRVLRDESPQVSPLHKPIWGKVRKHRQILKMYAFTDKQQNRCFLACLST